jgi:hypothetical protein
MDAQMDRPFVAENASERERLRSLVDGMTDEELSLPLNEGWTIASALAHIAFWDKRALVLMRKWKTSPPGRSPIDEDVTNDALLPLCLSIPPRMSAKLAVSCAKAIDLELEGAPDKLITDIMDLGERFRLYRSDHRKIHLDQIESFIKDKRGTT